MASDGEAGKAKPHERAKSREADDSKKSASSSGTMTVGDAVLVKSAEDKSTFLPATIVRKHMSGEFTVEYNESGKTEKYVKPERIQSQKKAEKEKARTKAIVEGTRVMYRTEEKRKWRKGVVKLSRKDGSYDVMDAVTEGVAKKVAFDDIKRADPNEDEENKENQWEVGGMVEFQDKEGGKTWQRGRVQKKRKDGTYDIAEEKSDGEDGNIVHNVGTSRIRAAKPAVKKMEKEVTKESDEEDAEGDNHRRKKSASSIRKRKSRIPSDDDDDGEEDTDQDQRRTESRQRRPHISRSSRARFDQLRLHQLVQFQGIDDDRIHRGYIKLLRKDAQACDIEHESDTEKISKKVPIGNIMPISLLSRMWGQPRNNNVTFQLNSRVYYRTKDGQERKGFVVKIYREDKTQSYDIEDELDGDVVRKVSASKLRIVPWISYPSISLPSLPSLPPMPSLPSVSLPSWNMLRKGMQVRVRRRNSENGRMSWQDGVIVRTKKDATCVVELTDSDGRTGEKVTVKNGDVRPRFITPFAGALTLPTLQLPQGLYPPQSIVEVLEDGKSGSEVFMGTVVAVNEAEKAYTILYNDGRKEKGVAAHRVRLSLRKLRIGTEVEMIVEGPCKEVSKLDGEVAWVHRNEKVAVRINGGNNDVFAEVCTHALMVDGQPAFSAPLTSTWVELIGYYANLALEVVVFLWFCFGLCVEIGEMARLFDETSPAMLQDINHMVGMYQQRQISWSTCRHTPQSTNGSQYLLVPRVFLDTDRSWLLTMIIIKIILTVACVGLSCRLVHSKFAAIQDNYIDVKEYQQDRVLRRHFSRAMGASIAVCFLVLLVYASLLNRFEWFCLFSSDAIKFDQLALDVDVFALHTVYKSTVDLLIALMAKSVFNLFRGVALYLVIFAFPGAGVFVRLLVVLPVSIAVTSLVSAMGVGSVHIFYYVQRAEMMNNAIVTLSTNTDWAVMAVLVCLWFNTAIMRLLSAIGSYYDTIHSRHATATRGGLTDDIIDQAERGEFGLQAKQEALYARVELKQEQLGVCKLSVLRVQQHFILHVVVMILGIISTCTIRGIVRGEATIVYAALTLHLVVCIIWLVTVLLTALFATIVKEEARELLSYILEV